MPTFDYPNRQIKYYEKATLLRLCYEANAKRILEIGSWLGESTSVLADWAKINDAHIHCVDWFKGSPETNLDASQKDILSMFKKNMKELHNDSYISVHIGNSVEASSLFPDNYFDLIFIDADHRYQSVLSDIKSYRNKVKMQGIICGHDCESRHYDPEHIDKDCFDGKHHGVIRAVFEQFPNAFIDSDIWWTRRNYM